MASAREPAPLLGQRVVLGGLSSRPELNGQRGVARSFEGGRYAVALEGGGESVRVRPGNLSPAAERASSVGVTAPDAVAAAAEQGDEAALLAWLDRGGRVDATYESEQQALTLTLLMVTSGWSSCCCGAGRRSTCRAAKAAPR